MGLWIFIWIQNCNFPNLSLLSYFYFLIIFFIGSHAYLSQVAFQQADFTGWNIWAAINQRPLLPFRLETWAQISKKVKITWLFIAPMNVYLYATHLDILLFISSCLLVFHFSEHAYRFSLL